MKQYEAVIKVMKEKGGYATLGLLYQETLNVSGIIWKTKTPFASIRRIVQDNRFFFKIRPGLWALKEFRDKLPIEILPTKEVSPSKKVEFNHSYYQGLLLEIGNLKKFQTSIPPQDKQRKYLGKTLEDISTIKDFYNFTFKHLVKKAQRVDVVWFNERKMPDSFFEIEHTTDMVHALLKFVELQDFYSKFYIVANKLRENEFKSKLSYDAFSVLPNRVRFVSYELVSNWHSKTYELAALEKKLTT
jgi:hypothetical protein